MKGEKLIPEKVRFRQKDLDKYLIKQKLLLNKEFKLEGELKYIQKNLKKVKEEIRANNNWLRLNEEVK